MTTSTTPLPTDRDQITGSSPVRVLMSSPVVTAGPGQCLASAADAMVHGDPRVRLLAFAAPEPGRTIGVAWRKGSPRERDFVALAAAIGKVAN